MRVFVRGLDGSTVAVAAGPEPQPDQDGSSGADDTRGTLEALKAALQARLGVPREEQVLTTLGGRPLRGGDGASLLELGVRPHDTLQLSVRLPGGKPVKVKVLTPTPKVESGSEVTIDLDTDTPMHAVKNQLAAKTGLEVRHQRVMLAGIGSMVLLDKRSNIGASYCGSTNNLYFATLPATEAPTERGK